MTDLVQATEDAITAADHLTSMDDGAIEAMRALARKVDAWDQIVEWALDDSANRPGARPAVPANDNVSISAYLKYCDQLGLSPAGRKSLDIDGKAGESGGSKLGNLRSVHGKLA